MGGRGSSKRWLERQSKDPYVAQAQRLGYRSRAVFKLQEIDQSEKLFRPGGTVVDLGAAPGGFSQFAAERVSPQGRVLAIDLLAMDPFVGVDFFQGDFTEDETNEWLLANLSSGADIVISDMAPNISGHRAVDQPRSMYLAELALELARQSLRPGGDFLVKLFQGEGFDGFVAEVRESFGKVKLIKPKASRAASREMYLLARSHQM